MQLLHGLIFAVGIVSVFGACPAGWESAGWVSFQQNCYKFQTDLEFRSDARVFCKWSDSELLVIETQAEQDWFADKARAFNHTGKYEGFWLAGNDFEVQGTWVWDLSTRAGNSATPMTFAPWGQGQPNNRENRKRCLAAVFKFEYKWSNEDCGGLKLQYVCEKRASSTPIGG